MASVTINQYAVWIKPNENYYRISLYDTDNGMAYQRDVSGPEELSAIVDLLRNEDRCWYDPDANRITVGYEPVGEEET